MLHASEFVHILGQIPREVHYSRDIHVYVSAHMHAYVLCLRGACVCVCVCVCALLVNSECIHTYIHTYTHTNAINALHT